MNTTDVYPMPDTRCPSWCTADHRRAWEQQVAAAFDPTPIPAAGGGFLDHPGMPVEEWLADWTPYHHRAVGCVYLDEGQPVDVDLARICDNRAHLYLNGEGAVTAAQARRIATALLIAADELDPGDRMTTIEAISTDRGLGGAVTIRQEDGCRILTIGVMALDDLTTRGARLVARHLLEAADEVDERDEAQR